MCVIMLANRTRPTQEMVDRAFDWNKDGAGIAWREKDKDGTPYVHWKKGLDLEEVSEMCKRVPTPFVVHFRVASVGGVRKSLTHPFPVGPDATLALEGRTTGTVLFHNGHWSPWADKALDAAINTGRKIPVGDWSDSRAMAWLVDVFGPGFMELLTQQKGILFGPTKADLDVFTGGTGWEKINEVWCSNDFFWVKKRVHAGANGSSSGNTTSSVTPSTNYGNIRCKAGKCQNYAIYAKDLCWSCDRDQKNKESGTDPKSDSEDTQGNNSVNTEPSKILIPAALAGVKLPLDQTLTLLQAENLFAEKRMSQRKIKKFRRYYSDLNKGGNKAKRGIQQLWKLSCEVVKNLSIG